MQSDAAVTPRDLVNQILPVAMGMMKEKTRGLRCVLGLHLLGPGGGKWTLKVGDGSASVEEGITDYWDCALSVPAEDYLSLASGQMTPYEAVAKGKIGISGSLGLAARLRALIRI